ncbi:hypothetical protein C8J57DRAFT_441424 [Mycena rebaudengoi]|nr:hypothetical protein C8J57DRAFT_441424 [Mycena rebaudengoi]
MQKLLSPLVHLHYSSTASHRRPTWWADEPDARGTYSLVSSCIFTLALCVWTAIHLNIPEEPTGTRQFLRKLIWLGVGLLAPEVVTFTAWNQHATASRLVRELGKRNSPVEPLWRRFCRRMVPELLWPKVKAIVAPDMQKVRALVLAEFCLTGMKGGVASPREVGDDWNLVHGFYAVMGGYAIDVSNMPGDPFLPNGMKRVTLTADGLRFLLQYAPEYVPQVSEEDINDKSKADGLAKLLVALQAAWFCMQCIARASQDLPISLLEITTGGHALYTLFTYILWAQKPMNISVPTLIASDGTVKLRELCAYMFMASRISGQMVGKRTLGPKRTGEYAELDWVGFVDGAIPLYPEPPTTALTTGLVVPGTKFSFQPHSSKLARLWRRKNPDKIKLVLDSVDMERWRLASHLLESNTELLPLKRSEYLVARASNVPTYDSWEHATKRMILAFTAAEVLYAAIHGLGWNSVFASRTRQLVWRTGGVRHRRRGGVPWNLIWLGGGGTYLPE